ncbi:MAG: discoidin domain-containing protein, partial [Akkermansia sp.]
MQTFANHNSDGGPSGHNYRKEESVEIAPVVEQVLDQCRRGAKVADSKAFERLKAEFSKMAQAPDVIRAKSNNPAFVAEVEPWLIQFESLGKAGLNSMQMLEATEAGNSSAALNYAMEAACLLAEMQRYSKEISKAINKHVTEVTKKNSPWQTAVKPSELVMAPAVRELLDLGSTPVLSRVSGQAVGRVKPYVSTKLKNGIEKMLDDDPESYFYCKEVQKKGDFFGVDLGVPREIRTVSIVMGRNDSDKDAVNKGQLEVSMDGQSWSPLMPETSGVRVEYQGSGKKGRFVRYRATVQGVPGGKSDVWTAIRDFKVNAPAAPSVLTDAPAFKSAVAETGDRDISLKRIMEVHPLSPRKSLGLQIPAGAAVESASI